MLPRNTVLVSNDSAQSGILPFCFDRSMMATEMAVKLYCIEKLLTEAATLFPRLATILLSMNPALCEERFFAGFPLPYCSPPPFQPYPLPCKSTYRPVASSVFQTQTRRQKRSTNNRAHRPFLVFNEPMFFPRFLTGKRAPSAT